MYVASANEICGKGTESKSLKWIYLSLKNTNRCNEVWRSCVQTSQIVEVSFWILGTMSQNVIVQYHIKIMLININITNFIEDTSYSIEV